MTAHKSKKVCFVTLYDEDIICLDDDHYIDNDGVEHNGNLDS